MSLQELPKTAATTTLKLVRLPVDLVGKALGRDQGEEPAEPAVEPTKVKTAKPKAAKKPAAKKTAARKPSTKKPAAASAAASPTPTSTASAAERAEVIAEQTDGLDDAVDRAQFELHKRDVDVNRGA